MIQPIQEPHREKMQRLAEHLDRYFNGERYGADRTVGWALLVFEFDKVEGSRINYISNADRPDMIKAVKEWLSRVEGNGV